jgi:hypothetical protein
MRLGLIGAGRIGAFHARTLADHPTVLRLQSPTHCSNEPVVKSGHPEEPAEGDGPIADTQANLEDYDGV